jgi:L-amino acid N-acyltransferase YncA
MKRIIISLTVVAILLVTTRSCKKGDVVSDFAANGTGTYLTLVSTNNITIDYSNLATTKVSITVKEYGDPLDKIVVYVTKGAVTLDRTKWKKVKEYTYAGETKLEVDRRRALHARAFEAMVHLAPAVGVTRLYALCHPGHRASRHVLERGGFAFEAILRAHSVFPNLAACVPADCACYAMTFADQKERLEVRG